MGGCREGRVFSSSAWMLGMQLMSFKVAHGAPALKCFWRSTQSTGVFDMSIIYVFMLWVNAD